MKRDIQHEITQGIIEAIEAGASGDQWIMPWQGGGANGVPVNVKSGRRYRGVNVPWLWHVAGKRGYSSQEWASFKQWKDKGAKVRKGEKAAPVIFWKWFETKDRETGETVERPCLRYYNVFNADQVEGYEPKAAAPLPCLAERLEHAENFVQGTGAVIHHGGNKAYHSPATNEITVPRIEAFIATETATATENYYSTLLHELTHWTRVEARLNRDFGRKRFGDDGYAMEELVAELGAAFLCCELGVTNTPRPDHAQYIEAWLRVLRGDSKAIITAASHAQKALDYLVGLQPDDDGPDDRPPRGDDKPKAAPVVALPAPAAPQPAAAVVTVTATNVGDAINAANGQRPRKRKIGGVTVQPTWHWSKDYASWYTRQLTAKRRWDKDENRAMAIKSARWLAERDGIEIGYASECVEASDGRIKAVKFGAVTIDIPNWDHVPTVTVTIEPEPVKQAA